MLIKFDKRRATLHPHLSDEDVDLRGVLDAQEGEQEEEETVSLNIKQSCQKKNSVCISYF